jgi:hypothetical protein
VIAIRNSRLLFRRLLVFSLLVAVYQVSCVAPGGVGQLLVFIGLEGYALVAFPMRVPDTLNLAYRFPRFRQAAFSAPVCGVLPERRRRKVSCHHRRRRNRRHSRGTTGQRVIGIEFRQADRGNVTGDAVNHQPSAPLPQPTRRRSGLTRQAIVYTKPPAHNEHALGNVMYRTDCEFFRPLSTYKVRTFKSWHVPSFSPTHHLIAVHLPKLTACALVAPVAGVANTAANREDPERCMRSRTWT